MAGSCSAKMISSGSKRSVSSRLPSERSVDGDSCASEGTAANSSIGSPPSTSRVHRAANGPLDARRSERVPCSTTDPLRRHSTLSVSDTRSRRSVVTRTIRPVRCERSVAHRSSATSRSTSRLGSVMTTMRALLRSTRPSAMRTRTSAAIRVRALPITVCTPSLCSAIQASRPHAAVAAASEAGSASGRPHDRFSAMVPSNTVGFSGITAMPRRRCSVSTLERSTPSTVTRPRCGISSPAAMLITHGMPLPARPTSTVQVFGVARSLTSEQPGDPSGHVVDTESSASSAGASGSGTGISGEGRRSGAASTRRRRRM
uniref:Unannotated protein n=1 Tax=freshwater metagenome TaxID=449393 RepID=A0A6J7MET5_9ZZZZ